MKHQDNRVTFPELFSRIEAMRKKDSAVEIRQAAQASVRRHRVNRKAACPVSTGMPILTGRGRESRIQSLNSGFSYEENRNP